MKFSRNCHGCNTTIFSGRLAFLYEGNVYCWRCKWALMKENNIPGHCFRQITLNKLW